MASGKDGGGWSFPQSLEIVKCKEGNKEFMREKPYHRNGGAARLSLVAEFSLEAVQNDDDARTVWRLAKRLARDFLRVSWMNSAVVTCTKTDKAGERRLFVYGKY